jgi:hypothetical protein
VSGAATLFSWRTVAWIPVAAGQNSWQAGLAVGFTRHLQWGPQVVFTFGPWGFLENILGFSRSTAALALVYALTVTWALAALIVSALRETWGLLPAGVVSWVSLAIAANMLETPELALATALGLALASLRADGERRRLLLLTGLGALAGLQLLVEMNVGLVTTGLVIVAVAAHRGRRSGALAAGGPLLGVGLIAWVAAHQSLGNLASYVKGSLSVVTGYSSAMSSSVGRQAEDWYALVVSIVAIAIYALAARGRPPVEKAAVLVMLAGWGWEAAKEGFVRHDLHDLTFFALVLVAICLARVPRSLLPVQAMAIALAALLACLANNGVPPSVYSPSKDAGALAQEIRDVVFTGQWAEVQAGTRSEVLASGDSFPRPLLDALHHRTVALEPWDDAIAVAYPYLDWDPEPVLQSYSAYTPYLDDLDASFLSSDRAPQLVLYQPEDIDGRDPWFGPPATTEALYCHYKQIAYWALWQILQRVPDRCGPETLIGGATVHFGEQVTVPEAPGQMVVATFSLGSPLSAKVEGLLLKPPAVDIEIWGQGSSSPTAYRFVPGTAPDNHVLAVPASLGYSAAFTPPEVRTVEVTGGGWANGQGQVDVTFYAVSLQAEH